MKIPIRHIFGQSCELARLFSAVLIITGLLSSCAQRPEANSQAASSEPARQAATGPRRDLSLDEERGGHTLSRHVGRTDAELRERLARDREISAASTYNDRQTAESVVGTALDHNSRLDSWLARPGGHPNLVIDFHGQSAQPIGRCMARGEQVAQPASDALIVLKWSGPGDYYVLTSYPECPK